MSRSQSKRNRLGFGCRHAALAAALCLFGHSAAAKNYDYSGTEINQMDAGGYASNNFYNGSGDSKDEGVRNGMRALNHLAALDIGGAIHYGYKGYGNYINSQSMDDLDNNSWKNKGAMNSLAQGPLSGTSGTSNSGITGGDTPKVSGPEAQNAKLPGGASGASTTVSPGHKLADMDHGFLYRGETGEVAAEFEKKSGMSRDELFNQLAATEASGLSWDDPNVADKMEARYQAFIAKIPNAEFRSNIEKMHSMFSLAKKTQVLEEAAAFYKKMRYGDGNVAAAGKSGLNASDVSAAQAAAAAAATAAAQSADRAPASVSEAAASSDAKPTAEIALKLTKEQMGMYLGIDASKGDDLKDLMGPEDTLFRLVSKRYRKLTPMMIGRI
jgi:hypothetical protein